MNWPTNNLRLSSTDQSIVDHCVISGDCSIGMTHPGFAGSETAEDFLFWLPLGIPKGSSLSIVSSRISRKLDEQTAWFDALRTLAVQVGDSPNFLITACGTTADRFIHRVAELFQIELLEFEPFPAKPSKTWFIEEAEFAAVQIGNHANQTKAFYKPLDQLSAPEPNLNVDELLIGLARSVVLLSVRKNGNVHQSARRRLAHKSKPDTRLLINRKLTSKAVESELLEQGAIAWWLYPNENRLQSHPDSTRKIADCKNQSLNANILSLSEIKTERFLAHWTRRRVGPWPDQSMPDFLDDLIFQTPRRNHSQLSTVCRILATGRILGSNHLTRSPRNVVCFTELELGEIARRRTFRPHLGRWDFEPYGIAIDLELLESLGVQRVIYGDESAWNGLSDSERAFFQLESSQSTEMDWSEEREWRIVGDVKLDDIPVDQAVVFVKTQSDAQIVSELSRWPVVVLEE